MITVTAETQGGPERGADRFTARNESLNRRPPKRLFMSDEEADSEPAVSLGERRPVDGAPLARVSSRLTWPREKSEVDRLEGDTVIRTPDGPRELSAVLEDVDETYFQRYQEFERHVQNVIGTGPVPTADE